MKKEIKNFRHGFTIAELLISMLVVMLLAAAMVPVIGPKKMKISTNTKKHGIIECYNVGDSNNMKTYEYYADSDGRHWLKKGNDRSCTFNVPNADSFEIFLIGSGTSGGKSIGGKFDIYLATEYNPAVSGDIAARDFANSLNSVPRTEYRSYLDNLTVTGDEDPYIQTEDDFVEEIASTMTEWAQELQKQGSDLYLDVVNIEGPVGAGGRALVYNEFWDTNRTPYNESCGILRSNVEYYGMQALNQYLLHLLQGNFSIDDLAAVTQRAKSEGKCFARINVPGGDSGRGFGLVTGSTRSIGFPVDGSTNVSIDLGMGGYYKDLNNDFQEDLTNYSTRIYGQKNMKITVTASNGVRNSLMLHPSMPGGNAFKDNSTGTYQKGRNGTSFENEDRNKSVLADFKSNAKRPMAIPVASGKPQIVEFNMAIGIADRINYGDKNGNMQETDWYSAQKEGFPGFIQFSNEKPFSWEYFPTTYVEMQVGEAGKAGDIKHISLPKISQKTITLVPGYDAGNTSIDTHIKLGDNYDDEVFATKSYSNRDYAPTYTSDVYPYNAETKGLPKQTLLDKAIADNSKFNEYINKINSYAATYGVTGGLHNCNLNGNACPGFAGSGSYPLVPNTSAQGSLRLKNNQFYANNQTYTRVYGDSTVVQPEDLKCKEEDDIVEQKNEMYYCKGKPRGQGAVIIVW